jgi:hypothetical protein
MALRALTIVVVVCGVASPPVTGQQATAASTWRVITDAPLPAGESPVGSGVEFAPMPPGWHVTTGPGAIVFDARNRAEGRFIVEAEMFLFPGTSQDGYGVFIGGADLEGERSGYTAFVLRRDGSAAVVQRGAGRDTLLVAWTRHDAVVANPGQGTARNLLRVVVEAAGVTFFANDRELVTLPRAPLPLDGGIGLRVGAGLSVHTSSLDLTLRLAPPRR